MDNPTMGSTVTRGQVRLSYFLVVNFPEGPFTTPGYAYTCLCRRFSWITVLGLVDCFIGPEMVGRVLQLSCILAFDERLNPRLDKLGFPRWLNEILRFFPVPVTVLTCNRIEGQVVQAAEQRLLAMRKYNEDLLEELTERLNRTLALVGGHANMLRNPPTFDAGGVA